MKFDPVAYLAEEDPPFDPVAYLAEEEGSSSIPDSIGPFKLRKDRLAATAATYRRLGGDIADTAEVVTSLPARTVPVLKSAGGAMLESVGRMAPDQNVNPTAAAFDVEAPETDEALRNNPISRAGKDLRTEGARELKAISRDDLGFWQEAITNAYDSLVTMTPGLAASVATRNPAPALLAAGTQEASSAYAQAIEDGVPEEKARSIGLLSGTVEVVTEYPALKPLLDRFGKTFIKRAIESTVPDILGEYGAGSMQHIIAETGRNPDMSKSQFLDVLETAHEQGKKGAAAAVIMGPVQAGIASVPQAAQAVRDGLQPITAEDVAIDEPLAGESSDVGMRPELDPTQMAQVLTANQLAGMRRQGADDRAIEARKAALNRQRILTSADEIRATERERVRATAFDPVAYLAEEEKADQRKGEQRTSEQRTGETEQRTTVDRRMPEFFADTPAVTAEGEVVTVNGAEGGEREAARRETERREIERREAPGRRFEDTDPTAEFAPVTEDLTPPSEPPYIPPGIKPPELTATEPDNRPGNAKDRYRDRFPVAPKEYSRRESNNAPVENSIDPEGPTLHTYVTSQKLGPLIDSEPFQRSWINKTDRYIEKSSPTAKVFTTPEKASKDTGNILIEFRPDGVNGQALHDGEAEVEFMEPRAVVGIKFENIPSTIRQAQLKQAGFKHTQGLKNWTRPDYTRKAADTGTRKRIDDEAPSPGAKPTAITAEGTPTFEPQPAELADREAAKVVPPKPTKERKRLVSDEEYADAVNVLKGLDFSTLGMPLSRHMEALVNAGVYHLERGVTDIADWAKNVLISMRESLGDAFRMPTESEWAEGYALAKKRMAKQKDESTKAKKKAAPKPKDAKRPFEKLSEKQQIEKLLTNQKSGIPNARAWAEAKQTKEIGPLDVFHLGGGSFVIGPDTKVALPPGWLKWLNDNISHDKGGDPAVKLVAKALKQAKGKTPQEVMNSANEYLFKNTAKLDAGRPFRFKVIEEPLSTRPRKDADLVDSLEPDERSRLFYTNEMTGLPNREDFDEALADGELDGLIASIDVNDLSKSNVAFGEDFGDKLLTTVADALKQAAEKTGARVWNFQSDEFAAHGTKDQIDALVAEARAILTKNLVRPIRPDGTRWVDPETGEVLAIEATFGYDTGESYDTADQKLTEAKDAEKRSRNEEIKSRAVEPDRAGGDDRGTGGNAPQGPGPRDPLPNGRRPDSPNLQGITPAPEPKPPTPFEVTEERWTDALIRKFQDKYLPLKRTQAAIREASPDGIAEAMDAYLAEELSHGKIEDALDKFHKAFVEPLVTAMAKEKVTRDDLDLYVYAKHAKERNDRIAAINPSLPDGGSGMTNEAAALHMESLPVAKKAALERVSTHIQAINAERLRILRDTGLASTEELDAWENRYDHYVPLKGIGETDKGGRTGRGFDIRGAESMRALGRLTLAESPVLHSIAQVEETLVRAQKNDVARTFLALVRENPNEKYWEVFGDGKWPLRRQFNRKTGEVELVPDTFMQGNPDYLGVKEADGTQVYVKIADKRLLTAMQNLGPEQMGAVMRAFGSLNRFLAAVNTSFNPEFVISNAARDIQTAVANLLVADKVAAGALKDQNIVPKILKALPSAMRGIYRDVRGKDETTEWSQLHREFKEDGGQVGFFGLRSIDQRTNEIEAEVRRAAGGSRAAVEKAFLGVKKWVEDSNRAVENAARLAVYAEARKIGVSRAKAASIAKNLTVNFNRKGELGVFANTFYLFFNASVQGTAQFAKVIGSKKGAMLAGTATMGLFALAELNRAISGDDDDKELWWDKIPDHEKERNLILMKWWNEDGSYLKIPLPYGYNIFNVVGTNLNSMVHGAKKPTAAASNIAIGALGAFNPIGLQESDDFIKSLVKSVSPTAFSPLVSLAVNEDYAGRPIFKENKFGAKLPDSGQSWKKTHEYAKGIAKFFNEQTGGSEYRSGGVDISPDTLQFLVNFATGGAGAFTMRTVNFTEKLVKGEDIPDSEIPFVRRIMNQPSEHGDVGNFYQRREELGQFLNEWRNLSGYPRSKFFTENKKKILLGMEADDLSDRLALIKNETSRQRLIDNFNRKYNEGTQ